MGVPQGVVGTITAVAAAPRVERGPGRVVLTTVSHLNDFVFNLTLQNAAGQTDTLGVTGYHKFYDQAEGWQSVVDLTVGDTLRGRDGQTVTVTDVTRDAGTHRVYNLTVEADHVYFVGDLTTLTHNNGCDGVRVRLSDPAEVAKLRGSGVYVLRHAETGQVLKVGRTSYLNSRAVDGYVPLQKYAGNLEMEVWHIAGRREISAAEVSLRRHVIDAGESLFWDATPPRGAAWGFGPKATFGPFKLKELVAKDPMFGLYGWSMPIR